MTIEEIVGELQQTLVFSIREAKRPTETPTESGCYAWWCTPSPLAGVPTTSHPVGGARTALRPHRTAGRHVLRTTTLSALPAAHRGNVGSSTFRCGLAALLWEQKRWTPRMSASGKFKLDRLDNRALSGWQMTNLRLRWAVSLEPWGFEKHLIAAMQPPMNRDHNEKHPFYQSVGAMRAIAFGTPPEPR